MSTKYKFIEILQNGEKHGKPSFNVLNKKSQELLCELEYYPQWRQYVLNGDSCFDSVFSHDCLSDIADFMKGLKT